ncbi:hypothetical protein AVEN_98115-2-1, partial [Araneus ventricosus]
NAKSYKRLVKKSLRIDVSESRVGDMFL